jgi:hypothetical protein
MKKMLLAMVAAAALISATATAEVLPQGLYVGLGGDAVQNTAKNANTNGQAGVNVGYKINQFFTGEFDFRDAWSNGNQKGYQSTMFDLKVGTPPINIGSSTLTPYALMGTGYRFAVKNNNTQSTVPVYNVGAGVVYPMSARVDLDVRYTYTDTFNSPSRDSNAVGVNFNYKY